MKKLFSGKFLFILASSLVVLILLIVGAFYLFDDKDDVFVKSGYVLNPLSSTTEKYFFDENVGYKENLSSMVEFVDVDENSVSVLKDSFLHYLDDSLSFLKKGAILDLDSVKGNKAVSFYNITKQSIIEKKDSNYVIDSANGEIVLKNFIGRISDNKYIIVGDLSLKMAGNDTSIKGEYFEIVYVEEGIVNIENKDVKYQVAAENTFIYVGNDKVIDFGDKKITVNGEDLMSITAITIDGDENIEIVPKAPEEEEDDNSEEDDQGQGENQNPEDGNGSEGDGNGEQGEQPTDPEEPVEEVVINLKNEKIGSTDITVVFEILNALEDDLYKLQVVNLNTGKTVDMTAQVLTDVPISVNLLTPKTKYLFTVINEKDNGKYFQKVIETNGFGIKLEKKYATSNSLAYNISIDENADINNAKLTLWKFNEETGVNEIVKTSFVDSVSGEVKEEEKIIYLSSLQGELVGEHEVLFDGLDSDTIYTAVLDEFSIASSNFKDIYNITVTSMTLKQVPKFSEMTINKDVGSGSFDLSLGNITDPDNAIVQYTYIIYDKLEGTMAIEPIKQSNASPINVKIGDGVNQLKNDTNYYYNVIIEYFDNEKYIEYVTTDSIIFMMGNEPYVTVDIDKDTLTHNSFDAKITLTDNSCLLSMPGREKCAGDSTTVVEVSEVNPLTGYRTPIFTELVTFKITDAGLVYDLSLKDLTPGTTYNIEVRGSYNTTDALEKVEIAHTDESERIVTTKELSVFDLRWEYQQGTTDVVIKADLQFSADKDSGTLTPEESLETMESVVMKIYEGNDTSNLDRRNPLATKTFVKSNVFNMKDKFYDKKYTVTSSDTFDLTMDDLKAANAEEKLSEFYIITVEAYTSSGYQIRLINNIYVYRVSSILLMGEIEDPVIQLGGVYKSVEPNLFPNLVDSGTYIGYNVTAAFDRAQLVINNINPQRVTYYVYDAVRKERVQFYIKDSATDELVLVDSVSGDLEENNFYTATIYMDYGTPYEEVDNIMRRGNMYYVGYVVECIADGQIYYYPETNEEVLAEMGITYGIYELTLNNEKETPSVKMWASKSDANSITYNYTISDPDNALYKSPTENEFSYYYTVDGSSERKIPLTKVEGAKFNKFEGQIKIDNLYSGSLYNMYYLINPIRTGEFENDVIPSSNNPRLFDGYYDAKGNIDRYGFRYEVINNPVKDNKVTIKVLASEELLSRIVSYQLEFRDSKGNRLDKEMWSLSQCIGDPVDAAPRCLFVDYTELKAKGMKSEGNENNIITVKVTALYDNGLTGFDFKVGNAEDSEYRYMIMQDYGSDKGPGAYISFSSSGSQATVWSPDLGTGKGYYEYAFASQTVVRYWGRHTSKTTPVNISVNLTSSGYSSKNGFLNPKMISVEEMECSGTNKFSFNSITPKVLVTENAALINGTALNLSLSGIDLGDIKVEKDFNYYLYVETWLDRMESMDLSKVIRPAVKVKINANEPTARISAIIDGLQENTTHYFRIYAYMRQINGEYVYSELFDATVIDGYLTSSYDFKTARASDIFHNFSVSYASNGENYGDRKMTTKMNLLAYAGNISFNFDIIYTLCEADPDNICDVNNPDSYIFKKQVARDKISTSFSDTIDISEYDLEFGKSYYMYIYAHADYYEDGELTKRDIVLNRNSINIKLKTLGEPSFVVTRNAGVNEEGYYIDFNVVVNDPDKTLVDGHYYVKLLDSENNLVGSMKLIDETNGYYDVSNYGEYAFDASVVSKSLRITGLEPNSKYTFVVYGDSYLNNYSEDTLPGREHRTIVVSRTYTVYSANDYGVAFGDAITYGATEKSIIVTFLGGSNFENVLEVNYTVGLWNAEDETSTISGTFVIGQNGKYFELYSGSEDWRFVIDPAGMKNTLGKSYEVAISVKVKVPGTNETIVLTSADVPGFEGKAVYVEDEK